MAFNNYSQYDSVLLTTDAEETELSEVETSEAETVIETDDLGTTDQESDYPEQVYQRTPTTPRAPKSPRKVPVFPKREEGSIFWLREDYARMTKRVARWFATCTFATFAIPLLLMLITALTVSSWASNGHTPLKDWNTSKSFKLPFGPRFTYSSQYSSDFGKKFPQIDFPSDPPSTVEPHLSKLEGIQRVLLEKTGGVDLHDILQANVESVRKSIEDFNLEAEEQAPLSAISKSSRYTDKIIETAGK
jgi:hypothetical protein